MENGSGEAEQLPLPGGEVIAPLPYLLIQSFRQAVDKGIGIYIPAGLHDFFITDAIHMQQQIGTDCTGKQEYILKHLPEMPAQAAELDMPDVDAVQCNDTLLDIVIPAKQTQNGSLSRSGIPHKSHGLAWLHMEAYILKHPVILLIGEPDVFKFDLSTHGGQVYGIGRIHYFWNHVHNGEDLLCRSKSTLKPVELLCQALDGIKELGHIHIKCNDGAGSNGLPQEAGPIYIPLAAYIQQAQHRGDIQNTKI